MNRIRRIALVAIVAGAFGAGAMTASGGTYEATVTPLLTGCAIVREAERHGIDARTKLPQAYRQCNVLGRFLPRQ